MGHFALWWEGTYLAGQPFLWSLRGSLGRAVCKGRRADGMAQAMGLEAWEVCPEPLGEAQQGAGKCAQNRGQVLGQHLALPGGHEACAQTPRGEGSVRMR